MEPKTACAWCTRPTAVTHSWSYESDDSALTLGVNESALSRVQPHLHRHQHHVSVVQVNGRVVTLGTVETSVIPKEITFPQTQQYKTKCILKRMCYCRGGWFFNRARFLNNMTNFNNNPSWLKIKWNDTAHPPTHIMFPLKIYLKKQSQPEILTGWSLFSSAQGGRPRWGFKWSPILFSLEWTQATQSINEALWRCRPLTHNQSGNLSVTAGLEAPRLCFVFCQLQLSPQMTTNSFWNNPS